MTRIPSSLFQDCQNWVLSGNRAMDMSITNNTQYNQKPEFEIWLYSYTIGEGVHVTTGTDIPTDDQLKAVKREKAEAILSEL